MYLPRGFQVAITTALVGSVLPTSQTWAVEISYVREKTGRVADGAVARHLRARCAPGEEVVSGGVRSSRTRITLSHSAPFDSGDDGMAPDNGWEVSLSNDSPRSARIVIRATCSSKSARYQRLGPFSHTPDEGITNSLRCERGKITGGGTDLGGGPRRAQMTGLAPFRPEPGGLDAASIQFSVYSGVFVTHYAVCTTGFHLHSERRRTFVPARSAHSKIIQCPREQRSVSGGALARTNVANVRLASSHPVDGRDADNVPDDGWRVTVRNLGDEPAQIVSGVLCAR